MLTIFWKWESDLNNKQVFGIWTSNSCLSAIYAADEWMTSNKTKRDGSYPFKDCKYYS